jgi:hypothetical protein
MESARSGMVRFDGAVLMMIAADASTVRAAAGNVPWPDASRACRHYERESSGNGQQTAIFEAAIHDLVNRPPQAGNFTQTAYSPLLIVALGRTARLRSARLRRPH